MIAGIVFALVSSLGLNASTLLEKIAVQRMTRLSVRRVRHTVGQLVASRIWLSGFGVGAVSVGLLVLSYSVIPIAVVQSIFGAGIVLMVLASRLIVGEHLGRRDYLGLSIIVIAITCVGLTVGSHSASTPGVGGSISEVMVVSGAALMATAVVFAMLFWSHADSGATFGVTSGLLYGVASLQVKGASVIVHHHGVVASISRILASPYPYLFSMLSIVGLLIFQTGLQQSRLAIVNSVTNVVASAFTVAAGMVIFNESLPSNDALGALRFLGLALVLVGTWVIATNPHVEAVAARTSPKS